MQSEASYSEDTVSHYLIEFAMGYVVGVDGITNDEARAWADDLRQLGRERDYFFSMNEYFVVASKNR